MKDSVGDPHFPVWLIGDSPPEAWADKLDTPLDPRHPARHNIWTAVADTMQDRLFRVRRLRMDISRLYIRNAKLRLDEQIQVSTDRLRKLLEEYSPSIVLTFGAPAYRIALMASCENPRKSYGTTKLLGEQFRYRVDNYKPDKVNIIPLLHVSVARGRYLSAHRDFVGSSGNRPPNYFNYVGKHIADLLLEKLHDKPIWID